MSELILQTEISDFEKEIELIMCGKKGLSYSSISQFIESPRHFYNYKTNKEPPTKAMIEGKIFHEACLEPDKFKENYWVLDDSEIVNKLLLDGFINDKGVRQEVKSPRNVKPYKEWKAKQIELNKGKEMLSQEDYDMYIRMNKALRVNKSSGFLMKNLTDTEKPFEINIDGFLFKGKIDGSGESDKDFDPLNLVEGEKYQLDLKKVADASFNKIKWDIKRKHLDLQAGLYSNASRIDTYFLVYIDAICNVLVVKLDLTVIEEGYLKLNTNLAEFSRCAEEDAWQQSYNFHNGGCIHFT